MEKNPKELETSKKQVKVNSSFMIEPTLLEMAKAYAVLNKMSYSSFAESLINERVSPYAETIKNFFAAQEKLLHDLGKKKVSTRDKPWTIDPDMQEVLKSSKSKKS